MPNHSISRVLVDVFAAFDAPEAFKTPLSDCEFVKERDGGTGFNRVEQGAVGRAEGLVAASAVAGVEDAFAARVEPVGVALID